MPSRRSLLAAVATIPVVGAGCLGTDGAATRTPGTDSQTPPPTSSATRTPTPTPTPTDEAPATLTPGDAYEADGYTVRVSRPRVRHGIVEFGVVHPDPRWESGAQFLVVAVAVEGDGPDPTDLPVEVVTNRGTVEDRHTVYDAAASASTQSFAFPVPTETALADVAVRLRGDPSVRWRLPTGVVETLRRAPAFEVEAFEVPSTAAPDTDVEASLTVRNVGDRTGEFLAELGPAAMSDQGEIQLSVPVGETRTTTEPVRVRFFESEETAVVLRWEGGVERRTVSRQ